VIHWSPSYCFLWKSSLYCCWIGFR